MKRWLNARKIERVREEGFSLIEIVIGIVIFGILTAIAVPIYINSQNEVNSQKVKTAMQAAGLLIEQEAVDNNGLYPTYIPNEIKDKPDSAGFVYSYSDARTAWCIQAPSPVGKLFISSSSNGQVISEPCTESNIAEGSPTPWKAPVVNAPTIPTINSHTWASNESAAKTSLTTGGVTCGLAAEDQTEWNASKTVQYRFEAVNTSRSGETLYSTWSSTPTAVMSLTGWLPGETVVYAAQARCLISNGIDYSYSAPESSPISRNIITFTVNPANFITTNASWISSTTFRTTSSWFDVFCPAGTKQSLLKIRDTVTNNLISGSTTWATWRTSATIDTSSWSSGGTTEFTHTVGCLLPNGTRVTSTPVTTTVTTALRPPVTPTGLMTQTNIVASTLATPTSMKWNAVTCTTGTVQYLLSRSQPEAWDSGWITSISQPLSLTPNLTYSYTIAARCVQGSVTSISSAPSAPLTFTAQYAAPPIPLAPSGLSLSVNTGSTTKANHTFSWAPVTCINGSTTQYQPFRVKIDNVALTSSQYTYYPWQTSSSFNIPQADLKFGSTVGFKVQARCVNPIGQSAMGPASVEKTGTLGVPAPSAPTNIRSDGWGTWYWDNPASGCAADTTLQFYGDQTRYGDTYSTWNAFGWTANKNSSTLPLYNQGHPIHVQAKARCAGVNANSTESGVVWTGWTVPIAQTGIWAWGGEYGNYTIWWDSNDCPPGTSTSAYLFQMDTTWGGVRNVAYWTWAESHYRGPFPDGTYYWVDVQKFCETSWVSTRNEVWMDRRV